MESFFVSVLSKQTVHPVLTADTRWFPGATTKSSFGVTLYYTWISPVRFVLSSCRVLKVEIAHPVDHVEQYEGGGEKDARVRIQVK